MAIKLNT